MFRFGSGLSGQQLLNLLAGGAKPMTVDLRESVDLTRLRNSIDEFRTENAGSIPSNTDGLLAPIVHQTFRQLSRRNLLDHRFWQWLACTEFPDYVRDRWASDVDLSLGSALKPSQQARFLGNPGLNGLGRNALSRLFWGAEVMADAEDGYPLTMALFRKQDLSVGVIERSFGLIPAVARACATHLADLSEDDHRAALRRLNLRSSTVLLETATEDEVRDLLLKPAAP